MRKMFFACLAVALAGGCTWVELKPGAAEIVVLEEKRVANCERLGKTEVSVAAEVGFLSRVEEDVARDLQTLARNQALDMGGDTIAPLSEISGGRQIFGVYRCIPAEGGPDRRPPGERDEGVQTLPYRG